MTANVHIFAECKAQRAVEILSLAVNETEKKAIIRTLNQYQKVEYAATLKKARVAKQFNSFKKDADLYPNIEWLPSSAVNPREEHELYYYTVRPIDDPFWIENFPGNLWGCKCSWTNTDKPVTALPNKIVPPSKGLEGNPAMSNEIFKEDASWMQQVGEEGIKKAISNIRNYSEKQALQSNLRQSVVNKEIEIDGKKDTINIGFNRYGIKHFGLDHFKNNTYKNLLIPKLDKLVEVSEFSHYADNIKPKKEKLTRGYYYFRVKLLDEFWLLNIEQRLNGEVFLYAITKGK